MCYSVMVEADLDQLALDFGAGADAQAFASFAADQSQHPADFRLPDQDQRLFPGYFGTVVCQEAGTRLLRPMRYSAFPPAFMDPDKARKLATFNARRDSLGRPFWSEAFGRGHGILVARRFFEWVAVADLLKAGKITASAIRQVLADASALRHQKWLAAGKDPAKFKPTKTESKPWHERDVVISFSVEGGNTPLVLPVIYSRDRQSGHYGFAIITDEPRPEILAAGHDRMPICLAGAAIDKWLNPDGTTLAALDAILSETVDVFYDHQLTPAG